MAASDAYEEAISMALETLDEDIYASVAAAAKTFEIKPCTLQRCIQGKGFLYTWSATNKALNPVQEQVLFEYIQCLDKIGMSPMPCMLRSSTNFILCEENCIVGSNWITWFLKWNPTLYKQKQQPLAAEWKNSHNIYNLCEHFEWFQDACEKHDIQCSDCYNMDETGFHIGCGISHTVITMKINKKLVLTDAFNCNYVISIKCISAAGFALSAFLIVAGAWILKKWALHNELPDQTILAASEFGYSNDNLSLEWIKHFDRHTKHSQTGAWCMLVMNGHRNHMMKEFLDFITAKNICLFIFSSHSTHLMQPLDVKVFQPYKHYHAASVDQAMWCGQSEFNKLDFFSIFSIIHAQAMTFCTILNAWKKTGLWLYNSGMILDKIKAFYENCQITPSSESTSLPLIQYTLQRYKEVVKYGRCLCHLLKRNNVPEDFCLAVKYHIKESTAITYFHRLVEADLKCMQAYQIAKCKCDSLPGNIAAKSGVVTVGMVHAKKAQHEEDEILKAVNAVRTAECRLEKKQIKTEKECLKPWKEVFCELKQHIKD